MNTYVGVYMFDGTVKINCVCNAIRTYAYFGFL